MRMCTMPAQVALPQAWRTQPVRGWQESNMESTRCEDSFWERCLGRPNFLRPGYIYVLSPTSELLCKVGKTIDFRQRYQHIRSEYTRQPKLPFEVSGFRVWECWVDDMNKIKHLLHRLLARKRLSASGFC
jgi:T5orf172 domain